MAGFGRRKYVLCRLFNHSWEEMDPVRRRCIHCNEIEYRVVKKNSKPEEPKSPRSKQQNVTDTGV